MNTTAADGMAPGAGPDMVPAQPPFFPVSIHKLLVMSFLTLGCYQLVWFFLHWRQIKRREHARLYPAPRAVFGIIFCYALFARIRDFALDVPRDARLPAGTLATAFIGMCLLLYLPDPYWLLTLGAVFALVPAQQEANAINAIAAPGHDRNGRFTVWNGIFMTLGAILLVLSCIGMFLLPLDEEAGDEPSAQPARVQRI